VRDARGAFELLRLHLREQLGHARGAAHALQARGALRRQAARVHGDAARVIAAVLEPLQALHQDGNDVARGNRADDAAHENLLGRNGCHRRQRAFSLALEFQPILKLYFRPTHA
jgi:hypothetical protein